jgi:uncharacterized membrane protein YbhN (UPF0104 family)
MSRRVRLGALLLGLTLLGLLVERAGPAVLLHQVRAMGPTWLALVPISLSWFLLNTWAWARTLEDDPPPFLTLLRIHLAAEAVSNVTPLLALGGEPLKVALLARHVPAAKATASVIADGLVHLASAAVFVAAGLGLGLLAFPVPRGLAVPLLAAAGALAVATFVLLRSLSRGAAVPLLRRLLRVRGVRLGAAAPLAAGAEEVDRHLGTFLRPGRRAFAACLAGHLGGRFMGAVEAWVILAALGAPVPLAGAVFLIAVVHVLVNLCFSVVPSQFGVQEAVAYALFGAMGLDPAAAVSLSLVRRVRGLIWTGTGLLLLSPWRRRA